VRENPLKMSTAVLNYQRIPDRLRIASVCRLFNNKSAELNDVELVVGFEIETDPLDNLLDEPLVR